MPGRQATVHGEIDAVHPAAVADRQPHDGLGLVVGLGGPAHLLVHPRHLLGAGVALEVREQRRDHRAGADAVHPDALGQQPAGEALRVGHHPLLGQDVRGGTAGLVRLGHLDALGEVGGGVEGGDAVEVPLPGHAGERGDVHDRATGGDRSRGQEAAR